MEHAKEEGFYPLAPALSLHYIVGEMEMAIFEHAKSSTILSDIALFRCMR
ncbi:hypothetical protein [Desulfatirhabdium butyrativorans]|nr:hypothetical protein [Desulfatirhabdium butyrativorans]